MRWSKRINFAQPLRAVRVRPRDPQRSPEEWEKYVQSREQEAYQRGLVEGEQALSQQLLQQRSELLELQNGVLASLRQSFDQVVRESESALIELAVEVAERLVAGLPITAEMVEANVRAALAQVQESTEFTILLHAEDLAILQRQNSPLLQEKAGTERMHFVASPEISRGGCLVKTKFGIIDARRETKLGLVKESLGL